MHEILFRGKRMDNGSVSYYVSHSDVYNCAYEIRQQYESRTIQEAADKWNRRADTNEH